MSDEVWFSISPLEVTQDKMAATKLGQLLL